MLTRSCKIADSSTRSAAVAPRSHATRAVSSSTSGSSVEAGEDVGLKKRKRDDVDAADPKLQEFLEVMGHPAKKSRDQVGLVDGLERGPAPLMPAVLETGESDDEYEEIPARSSKPVPAMSVDDGETSAAPDTTAAIPVLQPPDVTVRDVPQVAADAADDDWLRSRTNRLLDLVDPDDPAYTARPIAVVPAAESATVPAQQSQADVADTPDAPEEASPHDQGSDRPAEMAQDASRLFLRNLSYQVTEDDIREYFSKFGALEEVSHQQIFSCFPNFAPYDEPQIGTSYAKGI